MVDNDRVDLTENSSNGTNYVPFIGRITQHNIILAVLAVAFFLGFVVVISEHACNDKQEGQNDQLSELKEELAKAEATVKELQDKIAAVSCPPVSCHGITLKEIEIQTGNERAIKRNVSMDGNWIIIQRRINGCVSFTKRWVEYRAGFGSPCGNFWLDSTPPCLPASCDGVTLKEIEIPTGNGPAMKRNVSMDGNWTIIQRRIDGCVSFAKTWIEYRAGFGSPCGNFWLGLEAIHQLTKNGDHELRIDMIENGTGTHYWAEYSSFKIQDESVQFSLQASGYSGNASDSLTDTSVYGFSVANNQMFSTFDVDNDEAHTVHCASKHSSGWWYRGCSITNLNGRYGAPLHDGIFWHDNNRMRQIKLIFSEMKIRKNN